MSELGLSKSKRLKGETLVKELFAKGCTFVCYPLRVTYMYCTDNENRVMFSVAKRLFKRAVWRNTLKRRMREAYRLHQLQLNELPDDAKVRICYSYIAREELPYIVIEKAMVKSMQKLRKQIMEGQEQV
ncbi:MAG: ribonuclease P protein component [Bacteroidetes bacterium]|uniref:Ribonuclease P protein component n=1 Tax=Candidatus Gallipaludibacter merdavium TaxID=2840839 RepID=A0A9D9HSQ7_9BACT|nr:ribonuclease P protein component [Candidatus Gallipaludibacter merdavium]